MKQISNELLATIGSGEPTMLDLRTFVSACGMRVSNSYQLNEVLENPALGAIAVIPDPYGQGFIVSPVTYGDYFDLKYRYFAIPCGYYNLIARRIAELQSQTYNNDLAGYGVEA